MPVSIRLLTEVSGEEALCSACDGMLWRGAEGLSLTYTEKSENGEKISTRLCFAPGEIRLERGGAAAWSTRFCEGCRVASEYRAGALRFPAEIFTDRLSVTEQAGEIRACWSYRLTLGEQTRSFTLTLHTLPKGGTP